MFPRSTILTWLRESDPERLRALYQQADNAREDHTGKAVHCRGLVEISNHCRRNCHYCGIRAGNHRIKRYRLKLPQVLTTARQAVNLGFGTLVLQAGEDPVLTASIIAEMVLAIKEETPLAVTLSLGERDLHELETFRRAGADRYLLRFETSNTNLLNHVHPALPDAVYDRMETLMLIKTMGYETGSGMMVGLPGQTMESLADDLELLKALDLHMIGSGPFIPHPDTPLGNLSSGHFRQDQIPNTIEMGLKVLAITRLLCPDTNIPATTSLETLFPGQGYRLGLQRGANVIMPNLTPADKRAGYTIYPGKTCLDLNMPDGPEKLHTMLGNLGRTMGTGPGCSPRFKNTVDAETETRHRAEAGLPSCRF